MLNNEAQLLYRALCYEAGHSRRTQHILKVFALSKLLGETEKLSIEEQQILQAAAILHDIAIKYCKEHFDGDASQVRQKQEAPHLVSQFLEEANYLPSYIPKILQLVQQHHDYDQPRGKELQLLMEADLIVNCYESPPNLDKIHYIQSIFRSKAGKEFLTLCLKEIAE